MSSVYDVVHLGTICSIIVKHEPCVAYLYAFTHSLALRYMKHALLVRHNTRPLHILTQRTFLCYKGFLCLIRGSILHLVCFRTSGASILVTIVHFSCVHFSYYSTRENRKEVPSWLGLRCLSVLVLMQTISTLKVQLDAASYVADIVTFALKAPSKTWFENHASYAWPSALTVR